MAILGCQSQTEIYKAISHVKIERKKERRNTLVKRLNPYSSRSGGDIRRIFQFFLIMRNLYNFILKDKET